jgi:hypothetical protein
VLKCWVTKHDEEQLRNFYNKAESLTTILGKESAKMKVAILLVIAQRKTLQVLSN